VFLIACYCREYHRKSDYQTSPIYCDQPYLHPEEYIQMSLLTKLTPRPVKTLLQRFFDGGVKMVAAENTAEMQVKLLEVQARVFQKGLELSQLIKPHLQSGDPVVQLLAEELTTTLRETFHLGRAMLGQLTEEEQRELLSHPSQAGSTDSETSWLNEVPPALNSPELTAIENSPTHANPALPVKRGRGRPRKES
jgi:hypothetical protein